MDSYSVVTSSKEVSSLNSDDFNISEAAFDYFRT